MGRWCPSLVLGLVFLAPPLAAQTPDGFDRDAVVRAVEAQLRSEVAAFESRDCDGALRFYADQTPLFVTNGRPMLQRDDLVGACPSMVARVPPGARRPVASESVHALSATSAYSVTEFQIPGPAGPDGPRISQFVTKVWELRGGAWLIVHAHESLAR